MACSQLLKDEEILEISLQFLAWHVFLFPTHFWICFTYFSGMEAATLRPFMADIAAIGFLAPYLRLAINYYFSFGRMNLDPREVSRYFGTEHHKVIFFYSKLIFDWNECQTVPYVPYINNWNGKSSFFQRTRPTLTFQ